MEELEEGGRGGGPEARYVFMAKIPDFRARKLCGSLEGEGSPEVPRQGESDRDMVMRILGMNEED